jgi:hypothetical protein
VKDDAEDVSVHIVSVEIEWTGIEREDDKALGEVEVVELTRATGDEKGRAVDSIEDKNAGKALKRVKEQLN